MEYCERFSQIHRGIPPTVEKGASLTWIINSDGSSVESQDVNEFITEDISSGAGGIKVGVTNRRIRPVPRGHNFYFTN